MSETNDIRADRRTVLRGAAMGATLLTPAAAFGADQMADVKKAIAQNHDAAIKRLQEWIRNPSIAAENRNMQGGAEYMANLAREAGFQKAEVVPTKGHPGVFATLDAGAKKTLGIYFMYDVKQFVPEEWSSPPLEARMVDRPGMGKVIVGRGAVNQKGPEATFLAAIHALRTAGRKLPVNLVLVAEGEEEIGSPNFSDIVQRPDVLAALKKCVGVIIPFASQEPNSGNVTVNLGAKGIIELELVASSAKWGRGPGKDIHSSLKAALDSPAWRLVQALQTLVTPDGNTPAIDGWFENVRALSPREKALIAADAANANAADEMKSMGVQHFIDDLPYDKAMERLASQPTVNIEGLVAGYTGPGGKTVLPARAVAKIDCRLVPNMTRKEAETKLRAHLDKRGYQDIEVNVSGGYDPTETDENSPLIKAELATYKRAGAAATLNPRLAGSWPGVTFTGKPVGLPAGQFGLGHGNGAHAPNEYFLVESTNLKVLGMDGATLAFVDFLYQVAAVA